MCDLFWWASINYHIICKKLFLWWYSFHHPVFMCMFVGCFYFSKLPHSILLLTILSLACFFVLILWLFWTPLVLSYASLFCFYCFCRYIFLRISILDSYLRIKSRTQSVLIIFLSLPTNKISSLRPIRSPQHFTVMIQ